jgi:hypothetical protein
MTDSPIERDRPDVVDEPRIAIESDRIVHSVAKLGRGLESWSGHDDEQAWNCNGSLGPIRDVVAHCG